MSERDETSRIDYRQEIRLAIVMYGGVSLAIYMNGVAQELLRLVRATAAKGDADQQGPPLIDDSKLRGTESVYRQIGQVLGTDGATEDSKTIRTRFVIDILSGASAGGINAVCLAKALANGESIDAVADLWIDEGDIAKLINDAESTKMRPRLKTRKPPPSLLNGDRMYRKLLEAFEGMDNDTTAKRHSSLVDVVDLFVTATDIRGLPLPLQLKHGEVACENQHRHVFRFRYERKAGHAGRSSAADENDFSSANNPILAFAARCTSSFPFAFEPVQFDDMARLHPGRIDAERLDGWKKKFFPDYRMPEGAGKPEKAGKPGDRSRPQHAYDVTRRAFADGGYLDNKPFGHAIDTLPSHSSTRPVERKLLYVEPSPLHPEDAEESSGRPDVLENVNAALSLPDFETIRDDLKRVLARNELVDRVERYLDYMDDDFNIIEGVESLEPYGGKGSLQQRIEKMGISYGAYHRLKVAALTDEMASCLAKSASYGAESPESKELRDIVGAWREEKFPLTKSRKREKETRLLCDYDLSYRIRRLRFVLRMADKLCLDSDSVSAMADRLLASDDLVPHLGSRFDENDLRVLRRTLRALKDEDGSQEGLRSELRTLRAELEGALLHLRGESRKLCGLSRQRVAEALGSNEGLRRHALKELLEERWLNVVGEANAEARDICRKTLDLSSRNPGGPARRSDALPEDPTDAVKWIAKWILRRCYESYENHDLISFPILFATDAGQEIASIDVHRISPEDATSIVDERKQGKRKLAGVMLGNFGAFLDRGFRRNDMLWGRLDCAERLISMLLPGDERALLRAELTEKAHREILKEEYESLDASRLAELAVQTWLKELPPGLPREQVLDETPEHPTNSEAAGKPDFAAPSAVDPDDLLRHYKESFEAPRDVDPYLALRTLARSTNVVGQMLEDLGNRRIDKGKIGAWIARLGRVLLLLVEAAVPDSPGHMIVRHWLGLVYLFEVLLILGGLWFSGEAARLGLFALMATLAVNIVWKLLGDAFRGGWRFDTWWRRLLSHFRVLAAAVLTVVLLGLAAVGVWKLPEALTQLRGLVGR